MVKLIIISMFLCSCGGTIPPYYLEPIEDIEKTETLICSANTEHGCDGWAGKAKIELEKECNILNLEMRSNPKHYKRIVEILETKCDMQYASYIGQKGIDITIDSQPNKEI